MGRGSERLERLRVAAATPWIRAVAVLWVAQVVAELAFSFALPFIPLYIQELGVDDAIQAGVWAGAMSAGFALVMAIMGPVWGLIADRHGRRLMIQRALFGACLVIGAMGLAQSPEQLFLLRLLQGSVTGVVAATTTVVSLTVPRRHLTTALGLMNAALFVGTALGPLLGGVVSDLFGYRVAFVATGALFLVAGLLVTFFVPEPAREASDHAQPRQSLVASMRALLVRRELAMVIGLLALIRFASMAPQPILPIFIQQMAVDEARLATLTGLVIAATGVASTVGALLVGHLVGRFGRARVLVISLAATAILSAPQALATSVWHLLLLRTATGLALGGMTPALQALFTELTPAGRRGMAFGILATANAIGNGAGPMLGSVVAAAFGVPALFVAVSPVFAVGAWLGARLPRAANRRR